MPSRLAALILLLLGLLPAPAGAQPAATPSFDYYLLSLSWSPEYCATTRREDSLQCSQPRGFIVHGLWPQYERGYPRDCAGPAQRVPERSIERMLPLMPSRGLILHEWRTHGRCSGLEPEAYFDTVSRAAGMLRLPAPDANADQPMAAAALRERIRRANPQLEAESLRLVCARGYLSELRVCLDPQLKPRACGADVRDRCPPMLRLRAPR